MNLAKLCSSLAVVFVGLMGASVARADVTTDVSRIADLYQIDVIVFEHTNPNRFSAEHWPSFVGELNSKNAVDLTAIKVDVPESVDALEELNDLDESVPQPVSKVVKKSIKLVSTKNMLLTQEERNIRASKSERFIKHLAWMQPLAMNVRGTPIYFAVGKNQELQAVITIKPARNIFGVNVDAIYDTQAAERSHGAPKEIRLTRDVKIKKKEAYYLDHPVLGMLILITPITTGN